MTWECNAIDHSVTFFPDGKIAPCCQISMDYRKSIDLLKNPDRFADLKTQDPPLACANCVRKERDGMNSYRNFFNSNSVTEKDSIVFLDIRNTNLCNLKCRVCGPYYSSQWASELGLPAPIQHSDISDFYSVFCTNHLRWIYFAGGEPLINPDHWKILDKLSISEQSKNVSLLYSTNLTTIKYKDRSLTDLLDLWEKFEKVELMVSIDGIGRTFEMMRSGADWKDVESNLDKVCAAKSPRINLLINCVLSSLNIWGLKDLTRYFYDRGIPVNFILITSQNYHSLSAIPDALKDQAIEIIDDISKLLPRSIEPTLNTARRMIIDNLYQDQWHLLLDETKRLDIRRKENLIDLIPTGNINHEN